MKQLNLTGANIASSILIQFNEDYPESKNANFDSATIIDEEILATHFHNRNGKNVSSAVKDKKELRNKLVETGFDIGGIDLHNFCHILI